MTGITLKGLLKGLLGRLVSYSGLALGFWLLYQALLQGNLLYGIGLGLLGGGSILLGMYLLVTARNIAGGKPDLDSPDSELPGLELPDLELNQEKEGTAVDSFTGSSQSDKLPS